MENQQHKLSNISILFTEEILENAVKIVYKKKYGEEKFPGIENYSLRSASSTGDGFLGIIHRITVECKNKKIIRVIGKGMPDDLVKRKMFQTEQFFVKEILFYTKIVPLMLQFEKEYNKGDSLLSVPDCYYGESDGQNDFLILEDLLEDGYKMSDRAGGLNTTQSMAIIQTFAKFHGLSLAIKHKSPETYKKFIDENIQEPIFRPDQVTWIQQYLLNLSNVIMEATSDIINNEYMEKFRKFSNPDTYFNTMIGLVENRDYDRVISHGDVWSTNFMFNDTIGKCKAIDFQLVRFASPMLDLSTVIFACTTAEERVKFGGVKGILEIYSKTMQQSMTLLGAGDHSLSSQQLYEQWCKLGRFGLGVSIELVPISLADSEDISTLDDEEEATKLEHLTRAIKIKNIEGKRRLADMITLAVEESII